MAIWIYKFDKKKSLSTNVEKFLKLLNFDTLKFFTDDPFISLPLEEALEKEYTVIGVSVVGPVAYVKHNLRESFNNLKDQLEIYINSEEPFDEKLYELSKARIAIKQFLYSINFNDPVMADLKMKVKLYNNKTNVEIDIFWSQAKFSPAASQEIYDHLHLRNTYVRLLDNLCSLEIEKLNFALVRRVEPDIVRNKGKELDLLEIWIGLRLTGFLNHLKNDNQRSLHRKAFFELFELYDDNYKSRNKSIKKRTAESVRFINEMAEALNKMYKKKKNIEPNLSKNPSSGGRDIAPLS